MSEPINEGDRVRVLRQDICGIDFDTGPVFGTVTNVNGAYHLIHVDGTPQERLIEFYPNEIRKIND